MHELTTLAQLVWRHCSQSASASGQSITALHGVAQLALMQVV
jgi:hypothetical protein